jgi:hypothetical protein
MGMNSFKNLLLLFLTLFCLVAAAQQGKILMPLETDSSQINLDRQIEYRQLISGQFNNDLFPETVKLSGFDLNTEFAKMYSVNFNVYNFNSMIHSGISTGMMNPFYSPFYQNGMVLSEGAYKFGDKFTFGGFSYGANSMMSGPPMPTSGMDKFDRYGSTLFMQYKVSKNFKIETRFNVSQGGRHPGF